MIQPAEPAHSDDRLGDVPDVISTQLLMLTGRCAGQHRLMMPSTIRDGGEAGVCEPSPNTVTSWLRSVCDMGRHRPSVAEALRGP
jgi:hypothetical protein